MLQTFCSRSLASSASAVHITLQWTVELQSPTEVAATLTVNRLFCTSYQTSFLEILAFPQSQFMNCKRILLQLSVCDNVQPCKICTICTIQD